MILALAESASAQTSMFSTRFSGAPNTNVAIGVVNGRVTIVEQNTGNGQCLTTQASNESRLTSFVRFAAGNGANRVRVVEGSNTWSSNLCGLNITPVAASGRFIVQVFGNEGNDVLLVTEASSAFGEGGHDIVFADGMSGLIAGGSGNGFGTSTGMEGSMASRDDCDSVGLAVLVTQTF
jgi:hypothetical protein